MDKACPSWCVADTGSSAGNPCNPCKVCCVSLWLVGQSSLLLSVATTASGCPELRRTNEFSNPGGGPLLEGLDFKDPLEANGPEFGKPGGRPLPTPPAASPLARLFSEPAGLLLSSAGSETNPFRSASRDCGPDTHRAELNVPSTDVRCSKGMRFSTLVRESNEVRLGKLPFCWLLDLLCNPADWTSPDSPNVQGERRPPLALNERLLLPVTSLRDTAPRSPPFMAIAESRLARVLNGLLEEFFASIPIELPAPESAPFSRSFPSLTAFLPESDVLFSGPDEGFAPSMDSLELFAVAGLE